jgi:two-component system NarL family response regulator
MEEGGGRIRILIVEDHFMVRVGLAAIVNSQADLVVVAEAKSGTEAVEQFRRHQPDVTLMDLRIPGMDGIKAISAILGEFAQAKIIVISTYGGDEDIFRAMQAGARGYFLKHVDGQELLDAVRAVHAGEHRVPPEIAARLAERAARAELSPRELQVLELMARGLSNRAIAAQLEISDGTVRVHVSHLLAKLGCNKRAQAVSEAFQRGFIHLGGPRDTPSEP